MEKETLTARRLPKRKFISISEVAELKGVTRVAVLYCIKNRKLRACRVPGRRDWLIHVDDVRRYLRAPARGQKKNLEVNA